MSKIEVNEQVHAMRKALGIDSWGEDIMRIKNNLRTLNTNYKLLEQVVTDLAFDFEDVVARVGPVVEEYEEDAFDDYMAELIAATRETQNLLNPDSESVPSQE